MSSRVHSGIDLVVGLKIILKSNLGLGLMVLALLLLDNPRWFGQS